MTIEPNPIMPYLHDHMHSHAKAFINAYGYFMTNLDGILKSRDITLPTKVCLVKAMVFPVVMYGCESGTVVLEKTLESPLDCKEIQPVHPKGDQSWLFIGRTDAEAETPILWPRHAKS